MQMDAVNCKWVLVIKAGSSGPPLGNILLVIFYKWWYIFLFKWSVIKIPYQFLSRSSQLIRSNEKKKKKK